jgi:hypothetical protein
MILFLLLYYFIHVILVQITQVVRLVISCDENTGRSESILESTGLKKALKIAGKSDSGCGIPFYLLNLSFISTHFFLPCC